jgi:hypothetical protein
MAFSFVFSNLSFFSAFASVLYIRHGLNSFSGILRASGSSPSSSRTMACARSLRMDKCH